MEHFSSQLIRWPIMRRIGPCWPYVWLGGLEREKVFFFFEFGFDRKAALFWGRKCNCLKIEVLGIMHWAPASWYTRCKTEIMWQNWEGWSQAAVLWWAAKEAAAGRGTCRMCNGAKLKKRAILLGSVHGGHHQDCIDIWQSSLFRSQNDKSWIPIGHAIAPCV